MQFIGEGTVTLKEPGILLDLEEAQALANLLGSYTPALERKAGIPPRLVKWGSFIYDDLVELVGDCSQTCQQNRASSEGGKKGRTKGDANGEE